MSTWRVDLLIWPYSGVKRGPCPAYLKGMLGEEQRGEERAAIEIEADNFADAYRLAQVALKGVLLDERVWQANITAISRLRS